MKINAKTDTSDLRAKLNRWALLVRKEASEGVRQFARVACVNLATATQPFGSSPKDKVVGELAVESDISKVFYTPQDGGFERALKARVNQSKASEASKQAFSERISRYISSNNMEAIARLARAFNWKGVLFDGIDPQLHQARRVGPRKRVKKQRGHMVIGGAAALEKYKAEQKRKVGLTKAGWAVCAEMIPLSRASVPTREFPKWVKRNKARASGSIIDSSHEAMNPRVTMTNRTPWTSVVLSAGAKREALNQARHRFSKFLDYQIRYELRKQAGLKAA